MTGEVFLHGVERDAYFDNGFDSLLNFDSGTHRRSRQDRRCLRGVRGEDSKDPSFNVLTYISSHDTKLYDRARLRMPAQHCCRAPGGLLYGDDGAPVWSGAEDRSDPGHAL
jgi:alpha-amylase